MNEKICRLCLQTISENFQAIGDTLKNILKLNLSISKETVMCIDCTNNLQAFFNLKSACLHMMERTLFLTDLNNDVSSDPGKIENTNNLEPVTESKDEIRCSFCTKTTGEEGLISLLESKENMFLVGMLEKYIPEANLRNTEALLTCKTCLDELQSVYSFLMKCLDVEEKINKYTEIEGTDDKGQLELQDVQQFIFKPTLKSESLINELEQAYNHIHDGYALKAEAEIKYEIEVADLELNIKTEVADIKSEHSDCDSFQELTNIKLDNDPLEIPLYQCETCPYKTKYKGSIKRHILTHTNSVDMTKIEKFKCEMCTFETKRKDTLIEHFLRHKSPSEVTMFKCGLCKYETKRKRDINRHVLFVHNKPKKPSKAKPLHKCEFCTYETRNSQYLKRHKLIHKSPSEVKMVKCEMCEFESKRKYALTMHMLIHKNPSEVTLYKCETCSYETKRKDRLNEHKLSHKSPSEMKMFNCKMCTYQTKRNGNLKKHMLIHKDPSEVTMYKCEVCSFETKRKEWVKQHMLIHKKSLRQCDICDYKTKCKGHFERHMSKHNNTPQITN